MVHEQRVAMRALDDVTERRVAAKLRMLRAESLRRRQVTASPCAYVRRLDVRVVDGQRRL